MLKPNAFSFSAETTGDLPVGTMLASSQAIDRVADALEFVLALRRLDEHDVGAGLGVVLAAPDRLVESEPGARVGARDDQRVVVARAHRPRPRSCGTCRARR